MIKVKQVDLEEITSNRPTKFQGIGKSKLPTNFHIYQLKIFPLAI